MSAGLTYYIDKLYSRYFELGKRISFTSDNLASAGDALAGGDLGNAGFFLNKASDNMALAAEHIWSGFDSVQLWTDYLFEWIDFWWPDVEEYELTYQKICEAWGKNDFEGRAVTIAFIDRMRQILWDEPYSALWAAHPEEE